MIWLFLSIILTELANHDEAKLTESFEAFPNEERVIALLSFEPLIVSHVN